MSTNGPKKNAEKISKCQDLFKFFSAAFLMEKSGQISLQIEVWKTSQGTFSGRFRSSTGQTKNCETPKIVIPLEQNNSLPFERKCSKLSVGIFVCFSR